MRLSHICLIFLATLFLASTACAQAVTTDASVFGASSNTDWATLFITFLFQGGSLPSSLPFAGDHMTSIAQAMRHAMSIYSLAMLIVAAFLLFYHIAAMVAETAHHGVVLGKRANQIWAPIRLITAVVLLIPVGSGLSIGQHIILKIASSGSNVASHMWKSVTNSLSEHFFTLAPPHNPDLSHFIVSSIEMETCRSMYEQVRASQANDAGVRMAGGMIGLKKNSSTNLVPETWRYTNVLNDAEPMCGEYRFSGYRQHTIGSPLYSDVISHISSDISLFSHAEAENSLTQAKTISFYIAPSFMTDGQTPSSDIQANLLTYRLSLQQRIDVRLNNLAAAQTSLFGKYLEQSDEAGWITAAFFIPDLVRLQESYGEIVDHILPDVQEPVFVHRALTQQVLFDALSSEPAFHNMDHSVVDNLSLFVTIQRN